MVASWSSGVAILLPLGSLSYQIVSITLRPFSSCRIYTRGTTLDYDHSLTRFSNLIEGVEDMLVIKVVVPSSNYDCQLFDFAHSS